MSASNKDPHIPHIREVAEIEIKVPFGHIAGKWWGRRDVRPILCIHGWQDNAATFDTLIPLLPDHVGYLSIDLPGHGFSSRMPNGIVYSTVDDLYIINYIIRQFGWDHVSLMGHSLGAISCFTFAAVYPERVDLVIALDALQPRVMSKLFADYLCMGLQSMLPSDLHNIDGNEPPTYTIEEMIERMNSQTFLSVTRPSAMYLLARSIKESDTETGRYYFTRDVRLRSHQFSLYTKEIIESMAKSIECPFLLVKALQSTYYDFKENMDDILKIMMEKPTFSMTTVDGGHHVHLNNPERVCEAIEEFLLKTKKDGEHDYKVFGAKL